MPNPENIIPPKKGEPSRNPKGRPKGSRNRSTIFRQWLDAKEKITDPITGREKTVTQADVMVLSLIKRGRKGDVRAIKELFDSAFGKIPDIQTLQNPDGSSINGNAPKTREQIIAEAAEYGITPQELGLNDED